MRRNGAIGAAASATGAELVFPTLEICEKTFRQLTAAPEPEGEFEWPTLLRRLDRRCPQLQTLNYEEEWVSMPIINVQLFEGRTAEQKRAYAKALTEASVAALGCSPSAVDVIFHEVKRSDWASGGILWSEAE